MTDTKAASHITDHAFEPKGAWWTLCRHCNIAEAAHRDTKLTEKDRDLAPRAEKRLVV